MSAMIVLILLCFSYASALDFGGILSDSPDGTLDARSLDANVASFIVSPSRVYVDQEMTFFLNASSSNPVADISVTIYFDYLLSNGSVNPDSPVFSTVISGSPANVTVKHTYDHIGNVSSYDGTYFQVRAVVNDGITTALRSVKAYVVENTAPILKTYPSSTIYPDYNLPYNVNYTVRDWDNDLVTVTWDFGDGTEPAVNEWIATSTGTYVWQNHTWVVILEPGRDSGDFVDPYYVIFKMSVSFEDSFGHVVYSNHTVNITPPENDAPSVNFVAESSNWSPGFVLPLYASATDPEGDPMTWTFVFNDTVEDYLTEVYHTDPTDPDTLVWQNTSHTFLSAGDYRITIYVSDALPPYQIGVHNYSQTLPIAIRDNEAPGVLADIIVSPLKNVINTTRGYAEVFFSIQSYDPDGDVLYLSWDFGDGETASNQSLGGTSIYTFGQVHRYTVAGEYNVSVIVDDDRGHKVLRYRLLSVLTNNSAPRLTYLNFQMSNGVFAVPGSTVNFTITIADLERDPLTLWVDFGDNSSVARVELTEFSDNSTVTALLSHVYNATGHYTVTVTYTDWVFGPTHNVTLSLSLEVKLVRIIVPRVWNWWDYTSLSLVLIGVGAVFLRWFILGRYRKQLDARGQTLEEHKTFVAELKARRDAELSRIDREVQENKLRPETAKKMKVEVRAAYAENREKLRHGASEKKRGV